MKRQKLEVGHPLQIAVCWYDDVPVPQKTQWYDGEVIGWRDSQVIVRVKDYAVVRFWKHNGHEVGNADHHRRGLRIDLAALDESIKPPKGVEVPIAMDTA
jgi:hypothetical protein